MVTSQVFSSFKAPFTTSSRLPRLLPNNNGKAAKQQQQQQPEAPLHQTSKEGNNDRTEMVALNMILLEPKEPDGYLLAGQLYEKQGRLSAARVMYADSLIHVPTTNPRYEELRLGLKKLNMQLGSFVSLFAYDVVCIIFDQLAPDDLIQCTGVCQAWGNFMLQWPEFWDSLDGVIDRATVDSLLGGKDDRFHMRGTTNDVLFTSMLKFLVASGARNIKEMHFEDMLLTEEHIGLIVKAAKSSTSAVERITFKDVPLGNPSRVLLDIVAQCPRLRHFSHQAGKRENDRQLTFVLPLKPEDPPLLEIPYDVYMLTSLDLHMGRSHCGFGPQPPPKLFHKFIKRCPHLERLSVYAYDHINHGKVIRAAVEHCPRLKDLVVRHSGTKIPSSVENTQQDQLAGSETKGLERFVFSFITDSRISISTSDVAPVIKKHHKTLSTLYLHIDRNVIDTRFLFLLARYGMPQLRELYLYTEGYCQRRTQFTDTRNPTFDKAIAALVSRCPQLRILHIVESTSYTWSYYYGSAIPVTNHAISAILKHCRSLEELKINTKGRNNIDEDDLTAARIEELKKIYGNGAT